MSEKPVMHGWDHRPGGFDPIPGLGGSGLPWAFYESFSFSVASDGVFHGVALSMEDTSDSSILDSDTGPDSVAGPKILANGIYLAMGQVYLHTGAVTSGASAVCRWNPNQAYVLARQTDAFTHYASTGNYVAQLAIHSLFNVDPAGDTNTLPATFNLEVQQDSGGTITAATAQIVIFQLNPAGSGNF